MHRSECPSTSLKDGNIDEVKRIVLDNRNASVREIAEELDISLVCSFDFSE